MAITITQEPQPVVLSGNQSVLKVVTNNHLESGAYHIADWVVPDTGNNVTLFMRLRSLAYNIDLSIRVGPSTAYEVVIEPRANFATFSDYLDHIVEKMSESPVMNHFFEAEVSSQNIRLTSRIMRNYWIIGYIGQTPAVFTTIQAGADPVIKSGFRVGIKIMDSQYNLISLAPELREPNLDGTCVFDLSDYFSAVTPIEKPANTAIIKQISGGVNRYRIEVFEWLDNDIIGQPEILYITSLRGKSSFMQEALWNEEANSFYNYVTSSLSFLSTQPRLKRIAPNAFELLYLYCHTQRQINLKLKVYLSDGNTDTTTAATATVDAFKLAELDVSPQKLNVFQYENGGITVLGYDVWAEVTGISTHEVRQYRFDRNRYDQARTFLVRNDFGSVWEVIRATGECEVKSDFERNSAERTLPLNFVTSDSNIEDIENKVIYEFTLHWGFLSRLGDQRAWKHYIMGVELSKKVFEMIAGYMIPCKFMTQNADFDADNRDYYTHVSTYRRAYFDTAYSPDDVPIVGDYNDDYSDDYFN